MSNRQKSKRDTSTRGRSGRSKQSGRSASSGVTKDASTRNRSTRKTESSDKTTASRTARDAQTGSFASGSSKRSGRRQKSGEGRVVSKADLRKFSKKVSGAAKRIGPRELVTPDEAGLGKTPMPASVLAAISTMLDQLAKGKQPTVMVLDDNDELTTEQAAEVLGVSRPHLIQMLEVEGVPHRRVGDAQRGHRRIKREAVLDLKRRREASLEGMDELMRLSEQLAD